MSSYASVKAFAARVEAELDRVDMFCANAGIATSEYEPAEGNEKTITINVISTFLLAALVMPKLKATAQTFGTRPTLTITASEVHAWTDLPQTSAEDGQIYNTLNEHAREAEAIDEYYPISKLLEVFGVRSIAEQSPAATFTVTVNCVNPGLCGLTSERSLVPGRDTSDTLTLPDGRQLGFAQYGLLTGKPVFYCHGTSVLPRRSGTSTRGGVRYWSAHHCDRSSRHGTKYATARPNTFRSSKRSRTSRRPSQAVRVWSTAKKQDAQFPESEKDIWTNKDIAGRMVISSRQVYLQGIDGFGQDGYLLCTEFGFDIRDIRHDLPITLWYGKHDTFVPPNHGRQLAKRLGDHVRLRLEDDTHASMFFRWRKEILKDLVQLTSLVSFFRPASTTEKLPSIVVLHPPGGVKEQTVSIYAKGLSEREYVTVCFDAAHQGESGGLPRYLEDPSARSLDFIDADRIGILGICAGGGYATAAATADYRFKAVAVVSPVNMGLGVRLGPQGQDVAAEKLSLLEQAAQARQIEAKGGEPVTVPIITPLGENPTEEALKVHDYYMTPRAQHPRSENKMLLRSLTLLANFNHEKSAQKWQAEALLEALQGHNKGLRKNIMPNGGHVDFYDQDEYVNPTPEEIVRFLEPLV
ncbi:hypothetical protein BN1708_005061 [Verticillium longisporum]|uniref:AB hydrolase-1 domain-containing protein n=1 Tax=Verticillium longisporum TaxID=100787 RepID=A0A0G4M6V4_VERLO|nr:hypothetical protein BN1708_005061 [Verticillium longisporum]